METVSHEEVLLAGQEKGEIMRALVERVIQKIPGTLTL